MLQTLVMVAHLVAASLLIVLVLLQRGKGAEAGTGFGAGASGTVFGSRGTASFFSRSTAVLATIFFATSLALAYFAAQTPSSGGLLDGSVLQQSGSGGSEESQPVVTPGADQELPEVPTGNFPEAGTGGSTSGSSDATSAAPAAAPAANAPATPSAETTGNPAPNAAGSPAEN